MYCTLKESDGGAPLRSHYMMPMNMVDAQPLLVPVKIVLGTYPTATSKLCAPYITHPRNRSLHETKQVPLRKQMQDAFAKSTEAGSADRKPSDQTLVVDMKGLRVSLGSLFSVQLSFSSSETIVP